ncbi:MAG TPA: hypothetical protein VFJ43_15085, partial [Bacteroidia bacterium]|nr:hypothetical protein [Bacteroidia bacterium]
MKKAIFVFLLLPLFTFAQSPVTMPCDTGEMVPSGACLACAGSEWNNEMNITANDALVADITLRQASLC